MADSALFGGALPLLAPDQVLVDGSSDQLAAAPRTALMDHCGAGVVAPYACTEALRQAAADARAAMAELYPCSPDLKRYRDKFEINEEEFGSS